MLTVYLPSPLSPSSLNLSEPTPLGPLDSSTLLVAEQIYQFSSQFLSAASETYNQPAISVLRGYMDAYGPVVNSLKSL